MDCPTEEGLIRKRLEKIKGIERLNFDLMNRRLDVQHASVDLAGILAALHEIGMQASVEREAGPSPRGQATYLIEKMDCPTEEAMLRLADGTRCLVFGGLGIDQGESCPKLSPCP